MRQRGILPPRMVELARREDDDRTLVCYGSKGWYMIANEDDVTRQSVVLTTDEVRWLAELWRPSDGVTLIERIASGDFSGFNGAVKAAQEFLTERTRRLVKERRHAE